ncbi:MAG: glycerate kinase [Erysipelotrichaceae bacterium]|nr:glycerate kinase [Erysipelotrichaceae bacterium]
MKKCIIISDSFKGTLSTFEIIDLFKKATKDIFPSCKVIGFPVADGGEKTMETFASCIKGEKIFVESVDSNYNKLNASYFISNNVAYMDVATCIYLATTKIKNPMITTSYGVGLMIKDAIKKGCKKIIIGLGGSSTNDAGVGMLGALGAKFYNIENQEFIPAGKTLNQIVSIDLKELDKLCSNVEIIGMCDVTNPLLKENGATKVYGKQKGATDDELIILEKNMEHFHNVVLRHGYNDCSLIKGAGAAGGIGYALLTFLNAKLEKGIKVMLETLNFEKYLKDVDVIFTGEGSVDKQTLNGKVVEGIKEIASIHNIPVVVIAGGASLESEELVGEDIKAIITTTRKPMEFESLKPYSKEFYLLTVKNTLRLIKLGMNIKKN